MAFFLFAMAGAIIGAEAPQPSLGGKVVLRSLTPQDIKDYALTNFQVASGLSAVGAGQPVHLEAWVSTSVAPSNMIGVTWTLTGKPLGSAAVLADSPLGSNVPIAEPADRLDSRVAGRAFLRPDIAGQYTVEAAIATASGATNVTKKITAGQYMGVNTCALCHSGGQAAPNMVAGWSETLHATKFARSIDGHEGSYNKNCISCHTVGFDANTNAVNGGFDDLASQLGWTFPTVVTNGNWDAVPAKLKNLANIQCENCHGPGSEHAFSLGDVSKIAVSMDSGSCGQCHDSMTHHFRNKEWGNSRHAIATSYATGPTRAACVQCHSGVGFVDTIDGAAKVRTDYEAITCATCHDPHSSENPHQLRKVSSVKLADGSIVDKGGNGLLCMNCHKARISAATADTAALASISSHWGPHYGTAGDMLAGKNGYTYGKEIPSSTHRDVVTDACVTCHMQELHNGAPGFTQVGGHSFKPSWDGGTPDNLADDVKLTAACVKCHGPTSTFDIKRQDYDGDGAIEGVQTEVEGLLHELAELLPPAGPTVVPTTNYTRAELRAVYNYNFVHYDGSYGIHNLNYTVGLLKASIADLTDDADHDGLSDKWEVASFGSILHCAPMDDFDGDGVNAALEMAAGTNPTLADSDGDGIADLAEFDAGSDPLNAEDKPGFVIKVHNASELEFASEAGKSYQIQRISELNASWETVSTNILGTGETISHLVSTRNGGSKAFYRVVSGPASQQ